VRYRGCDPVPRGVETCVRDRAHKPATRAGQGAALQGWRSPKRGPGRHGSTRALSDARSTSVVIRIQLCGCAMGGGPKVLRSGCLSSPAHDLRYVSAPHCALVTSDGGPHPDPPPAPEEDRSMLDAGGHRHRWRCNCGCPSSTSHPGGAIPRAIPRAIQRAIPRAIPGAIPRAIPRTIPGVWVALAGLVRPRSSIELRSEAARYRAPRSRSSWINPRAPSRPRGPHGSRARRLPTPAGGPPRA